MRLIKQSALVSEEGRFSCGPFVFTHEQIYVVAYEFVASGVLFALNYFKSLNGSFANLIEF
jgi:hypothetical protein